MKLNVCGSASGEWSLVYCARDPHGNIPSHIQMWRVRLLDNLTEWVCCLLCLFWTLSTRHSTLMRLHVIECKARDTKSANQYSNTYCSVRPGEGAKNAINLPNAETFVVAVTIVVRFSLSFFSSYFPIHQALDYFCYGLWASPNRMICLKWLVCEWK